MSRTHSLVLVLAATATLGLAATGIAHAGANYSQTKQAGPYSVDLKLLPAEPFVSLSQAKSPAHAGAMVNAGGAPPILKVSAGHPNYHLVAFISKNGQPVEHAKVQISYRKQGVPDAPLVDEPVTRMWVAGAGRKTTHYGNNIYLTPGTYKVLVVVNGSAPVSFEMPVQ